MATISGVLCPFNGPGGILTSITGVRPARVGLGDGGAIPVTTVHGGLAGNHSAFILLILLVFAVALVAALVAALVTVFAGRSGEGAPATAVLKAAGATFASAMTIGFGLVTVLAIMI